MNYWVLHGYTIYLLWVPELESTIQYIRKVLDIQGPIAVQVVGESLPSFWPRVMAKLTIEVVLNGTPENPYHRMGLKCNPFPQLGINQYDALCMRVQELAGDPIKDVDDLRKRLDGFSPEFVDLCVEKFRPGETVKFKVTFEGED